ncbi:hypothetical protein ATANTOWER_000298 [Ataeniobius toweri]|uniref:Uncharacterized protein n=1 Tax=Ataeniobius toweri TaxID=208326 RepID=A0ABU7BPW2_9TELE|nr:hypothetical protein [Ataeniobius toweri]
MADQELNHELESRLQLQWRGERRRGQEASSFKWRFVPGPFVARPQWRGESEDQGKKSLLASSQSWRLPAISSLLHGELGEVARWENNLTTISPLLNSLTIPHAWSRWLVPSVIVWFFDGPKCREELLKLKVFNKDGNIYYSRGVVFPGGHFYGSG